MPEAGRLAALWTGILGPPIVWLCQFEINFAIVHWTCANSSAWLIHLVTLVALLLAAGSGVVGWRAQASSAAPDYVRFMGIGGAILGAGFSLVILAQGLASVVLGPCA